MESNQDSSGFMNPKNEEEPEPVEIKGPARRLQKDGETDPDRAEEKEGPHVSVAEIDEDSTYKRIEGLKGAGDDEPVDRPLTN